MIAATKSVKAVPPSPAGRASARVVAIVPVGGLERREVAPRRGRSTRRSGATSSTRPPAHGPSPRPSRPAGVDRVVVVSPDPTTLEARRLGRRPAAPPAWPRPQLRGLREARDEAVAAGADAILVLPVDLPMIATEALGRRARRAQAIARGRPLVVARRPTATARHERPAPCARPTRSPVPLRRRQPRRPRRRAPRRPTARVSSRSATARSRSTSTRPTTCSSSRRRRRGGRRCRLTAADGRHRGRRARRASRRSLAGRRSRGADRRRPGARPPGRCRSAPDDVLVVTQKIVSKAEGAIVDLTTVEPRPEAVAFADALGPRPAPARGRPARGAPRRPHGPTAC